MAYTAGSYRQLLFGVSQQTAKDRLDGQVEEQLNMVSDLVTGPRRRSPVRVLAEVVAYTDLARIARGNASLGGVDVLLLVNTVTGALSVVNDTTGAVLYSATNSYLTATAGSAIRFAAVADSVFLANTEVIPQVDPWSGAAGLPDPEKSGYIYIVAGSFAKTYTLSVTNRTSGITYTVSVTSSATEAAEAQPEFIMTSLRTVAEAHPNIGTAAGVTYYQDGAYLYLVAPFPITVSTDSGSSFIRASNASSIRDASELPAKLASVADGYIVATGAGEVKTYYRWIHLEKRWVEDASVPAQSVLTDMPMRLTYNGAYSLTVPEYERRASGDADSNPALKFTENGITGMATMQGRLVLLAGEYICMSASNKPLRWFRASVASVLDDDPIEVAATAAVSSPYEYAVQFNKDLVLFAKTHQGIVPGANLITPRTASASVVTNYSFAPVCSPALTGRTVFFPAPRAGLFSALWEMIPSQFTDAQVEADDSTAHIPRYITGPVRFISASTTTNIVVVGTGDTSELIVHEYQWQGGQKVHTAWHRWTFQHPVSTAYFNGDRLVMIFGAGGQLVLADIDLRAGAGVAGAELGRLDFGRELTCTVAGQLTLPDWVYDLHTSTALYLFKLTGTFPFLGQRVLSVTPASPNVLLAVPDALVGEKYWVGSKYLSKLAPTRPILKDRNDVPITTERTQLHKLTFSVENTGEVTFRVGDVARGAREFTTTPLRLFSQDLGAGTPLATSAQIAVPCRVDMQTATLSAETDDFYDLNIISLEYGFRYHQRYRR